LQLKIEIETTRIDYIYFMENHTMCSIIKYDDFHATYQKNIDKLQKIIMLNKQCTYDNMKELNKNHKINIKLLCKDIAQNLLIDIYQINESISHSNKLTLNNKMFTKSCKFYQDNLTYTDEIYSYNNLLHINHKLQMSNELYNSILNVVKIMNEWKQEIYYVSSFSDDPLLLSIIIPVKNICIVPIQIFHSSNVRMPQLVYTKELFNQWKNTLIGRVALTSQSYKLGTIECTYSLYLRNIHLNFCFKYTNSTHVTKLFTQIIQINKLIYADEGEIFWNWYGGTIPISTNISKQVICDKKMSISADNSGWVKYNNIPTYEYIDGIIHKKLNAIKCSIQLQDITYLKKILFSHVNNLNKMCYLNTLKQLNTIRHAHNKITDYYEK